MLGLDDLQGQLQRPGFRAGKRRGEHRLRRRRQALPAELAEQRHRVREVGSRYAQYHRHDLVGPHRQGDHPHAGGRTGAKRHQAERATAGTRVSPYALGSTGTKIGENITFLRDRVADIDTIAAKTASVIDATKRLENLTRQLANGTHISRESAEQLTDSYRGGPRPSGRLRRLHAADAQLLPLGAALLRHPDLLGVPFAVRDHRHRQRDN